MKNISYSILIVIFFLSAAAGQEKQFQGNKEKGVKAVQIKSKIFGRTPDGKTATIYTLTNKNGMAVKITNYGAIITEMRVPDKNGNTGDVVLGFDNLKDYMSEHPYFGCVVGRYANRIAGGKFTLDGKEYTLAKNNGGNHLHGGLKGFDKVLWSGGPLRVRDGVALYLDYTSIDGEEGYPGKLTASVIYTLTNENELKISYEAATDKPTPVNLTHHSYFNLAGAGSGDILNHIVTINADNYTPVASDLIPTGEIVGVSGTPFDFRTPREVGDSIGGIQGGYDHNFVLNRKGDSLILAASVFEPLSGRMMEVHTTEPGMQFYTGNFLDGSIKGKGGKVYKKHYGLCLEAQHYPDSPNRPGFPSVILKPGEKYRQETIYKFSARE